MRIVALDPGGTTGWASANSLALEYYQWQRGQLTGEHHEELWHLLQVHQPEVLVIERFQYQRRDMERGVQLNIDAREYIGVAKLWAKIGACSSVDLVLQTPHQRKVFDDEKLKKMSLYLPAMSHAMDATRHLLYYLVVTCGQRELLDVLRPS